MALSDPIAEMRSVPKIRDHVSREAITREGLQVYRITKGAHAGLKRFGAIPGRA